MPQQIVVPSENCLGINSETCKILFALLKVGEKLHLLVGCQSCSPPNSDIGYWNLGIGDYLPCHISHNQKLLTLGGVFLCFIYCKASAG